jgi:predicted transcriptional regulator
MVVLSLKADDSLASRLDALVEAMSVGAAGAKISRSNAMRVALERGLDALEAEFNVKKKPKR